MKDDTTGPHRTHSRTGPMTADEVALDSPLSTDLFHLKRYVGVPSLLLQDVL